MSFLVIKAVHVIFMVTWFAGLFYLPRLFVYHAMCTDIPGRERFKVMERKLFWGIMTPGAIITIVLGLWMIGMNPSAYAAGWMHLKLLLVVLLVAYHIWCGVLLMYFRDDRNRHGHQWYRWFNEIPVFMLVGIVLAAVTKSIMPAVVGMGILLAIFAVFAVLGMMKGRR